MNWIVADLLMFSSSVVLYLTVRKATLLKMPIRLNNFAGFAVPLVIFTIMALVTHQSFALSWQHALIILVTGICCAYLGNRFSLMSIELSPNPGYSLIISKSYVVLTTFLAVPLFHAHLSAGALIAVGLIVAFSALIMINPLASGHAKSTAWLPLAAGAFFAWAFLQLVAKYLFLHGVPTLTFLVYLFLVVTVCISIELVKYATKPADARPFLAYLLLIGIASASFNFFNFYAVRLAPNVGYVNATNAASIAAVTVFAILLFKDEFSWRKIIGVTGVVAGLFLLFLT